MGKHIDNSTHEQFIIDVKSGMKVNDAAVKHGIHIKTAYAILRRQADNTGTSVLEIAKLRRENQELKEIIGLFALEKKRAISLLTTVWSSELQPAPMNNNAATMISVFFI